MHAGADTVSSSREVIHNLNNKTMKTLKFLKFALITVLMCVGFASCGDDNDKDNEEPSGGFSVVGIWDVMEADESYDFRADGHGIYFMSWDDGAEIDEEYFDYEYTSSNGNLVMKWHSDEDWSSPIISTMTAKVKVISNNKVTITTDLGNTATLVRRK